MCVNSCFAHAREMFGKTVSYHNIYRGRSGTVYHSPASEIWGRFHEASFVFSFLKVKEGGFLTFGKASLKSCFTKPPLFHLNKDFP